VHLVAVLRVGYKSSRTLTTDVQM